MQLTVAAFAVLACFAISCNAATPNDLGISWRHQFQYFLTKADTASVAAVSKVLTNLTTAWNKTNGGLQTFAFNSDLGLASVLYPGNMGKNADYAGRIDFNSQAALTSFWKFLNAQTAYATMKSTYVKSAFRIQYLAKTSLYAPGTYYRSTFEYTWNATSVASDKVQALNVMWYTWAQTSPTKPKAYAGGADLGLASTLYTSTNFKFGGSITFYTLDDLKAFWKWLYAMPAYKTAMASIDAAVRIQYAAVYK